MQRTQVYCQQKNYFIMLRNVYICATQIFNSICLRKNNCFLEKKIYFSNERQILNAQTHSTTSPFSAVIPYGQGVAEECRGFAKQTRLVCTQAQKSAEGDKLEVLMDLKFSKALEMASHEILPSDKFKLLRLWTLSSGLKTGSRNKVKGGDKEQCIRLWIEKCQRDFCEVGLVSYFINDLQERTENKFTNSAADTELGRVSDTRQDRK